MSHAPAFPPEPIAPWAEIVPDTEEMTILWLDRDLHIAVQRGEEPQQAFQGEPRQAADHQVRNPGLFDAKDLGCLDLSEAPCLDNLTDAAG